MRFHLPGRMEQRFIFTLSAGSSFQQMMGDPDPEVRAQLFAEWEKAWGEKEDLFARITLNHLGWIPSLQLQTARCRWTI